MRRWALASLAATLSLAGSAGDAFASGYANAVLADNPQLYWRLGEDASTGTATDRAGHYDGTYTRWNPGKGTSQPRTASPVPSALPADPDGAQAFPMNTYVETPPLPAFDTGAIEFWMRNTSTAPEASPPGNANMLWRGSDPPPSTGYWSLSGQGYACCDGALSTPAFINGTLVDYGGTIFSSGWMREEPAWHQYVARWTSTTIELWRDGQQFGSISTCCGGTSPAGERIRIGNVDHTGAITGATWELDDVAVYSDLPPARIAAHYEARNAPTNLTPPTITAPDDGSGPVYRHDTALTASDGTWAGDQVTYFPHWLRCRSDGSLCVQIPGATSQSYTPNANDVGATLRFRMTARNLGGEDTTDSAPTPVIKPLKPEPGSPPLVSGPASPQDGDTLASGTGTWSGDAADYYAYEWLRCSAQGTDCVPVPDESGPSHRLNADDVDHTIRVQATAVNASGSASQVSVATTVIRAIPVANVRLPSVAGTARVGEVLSGDDGAWSGSSPHLERIWLRCSSSCAPIPGATDPQYAITGQDVGFSLRYQVTASNSANVVTKTTETVGPIVGVGETPPLITGPSNPSSSAEPRSQAPPTQTPSLGPENGHNLAGPPSLSLQFSSNQRAVDTVPFGQTTYVGGRLVNERGEPIAEASIAVEARSAVGGDFHGLADVVTDPDGNFRLQIGPGPSRIVRASYRSHRLDRDASATAQVQLAVLATGLLQAQRRRLTLGDQAVFRGRLAGDPFPASGIPVTLEAKDGPRWAQVARGRTSRDGQFTFRYRFCKTVRTYTYGFRVSIGQTAGWPYDPGATNQTRVQVRVPRRATKRIAARCR